MKIEVLLADDHAIIRNGLRNLINDTDDLIVADEAVDGDSLLGKVKEREWGLLVLDLSMPGLNGVELIRSVKAARPRVPILVFSMYQEEQYAVRAIRSGASGYLTKDCDSDLLIPAMRKVAGGGVFVSQRTAELLVTEHVSSFDRLPHMQLSNREFEIFTKIIEGRSMTEIAGDLGLSIKTVSTHKTHIFEKMKATSQVDLVRYAVQHKLIATDHPDD